MSRSTKGGSAEGDLLLFLGILAAFFVLWLINGGPERATSHDPLVDFEAETTIEDDSEIGFIRESQSAAKERQRIEFEIQNLESQLSQLEKEIQEARIKGTASPYEGLIYISRASYPEALLSRDEYITLEAEFDNDIDINVTGWQLESLVTGNRGVIGTVSNLPTTNQASPQTSLLLPPGGRAVIITGRSPMGTSFRLNQCIGYFEQFQNFRPSLPLTCPLPREELERYGKGVPTTDVRSENDAYDICEDFVSSIPQCEIYRRDLEEVDDLHRQCEAFVRRHLTYQGCVANHRLESDFYNKEWRVYIGRVAELWRERREIIRLLDERGRTVDVLTY